MRKSNKKELKPENNNACGIQDNRDAVIRIRGARQHNLKNISLDLPRNRLVVITGLSGSGKSSLAFDTLYAEGQRRYVESLSAYARQFLDQMEKPDVDAIEGLSPAIAIEQKTTHRNPRSTVATVTEIYDYLRVLFARAGDPHCPQCGRPIVSQTSQQIVDGLLALPEQTQLTLMAPVVRQRKGTYQKIFEEVKRQGYTRVRVDGVMRSVEEDIELERYVKHDIDVVVDRIRIRDGIRRRLADSVETCLKLGSGLIRIEEIRPDEAAREYIQSEKLACIECGIAFEELEPRSFSFNNPHGACPACTGLGSVLAVDPEKVIPDENLSIAEGAVRPWSQRRVLDAWFRHALVSVCRHYGQSAHAPWHTLPDWFRKIVLYGSGKEEITFSYISDSSTYETR
ncbi:MAG TPA: excinuclease ABC subunit UvrA, partial [Candidatus Hydrogenedentes bacterium]|nr:excinuclease ABC subunit UvrA [Candidatus Hydrogenedentota bacterium]